MILFFLALFWLLQEVLAELQLILHLEQLMTGLQSSQSFPQASAVPLEVKWADLAVSNAQWSLVG